MTGEEIRAAREARGMTQGQLAIAAGVGLRTIGAWERGETVPRNRLGRLRQIFGMDNSNGTPADPGALHRVSTLAMLTELLRRESERVTREE